MKPSRWYFPHKSKRPLLLIHFRIPQAECLWHWHPEAELTFILKGNGKRKIGEVTENFSSGDVVFIGGGLPHAYWGEKAPDLPIPESEWDEVLVVIFGKDIDPLQFSDMPEFLDRIKRAETHGIHFGKESSKSLTKLAQEMLTAPLTKRLSMLYMMCDIIAHAQDLRDINQADVNADKSQENAILKRAIEFIEIHFREPIQLDDVAHHVSMKTDTFSRWFKKMTGATYRDFLTMTRLGHAQQMLISTEKTVMEIAFDAGYENLANFNTIFKKHLGMSPLNYRNVSQKISSPRIILPGSSTTNQGYLAIPEGTLTQIIPIE